MIDRREKFDRPEPQNIQRRRINGYTHGGADPSYEFFYCMPTSQPIDSPITEFNVVDDRGTLELPSSPGRVSRADFYEYAAINWRESPADLLDASQECRPLFWAVCTIYGDYRESLEMELEYTSDDSDDFVALVAKLETMAEESEEGAAPWIKTLTLSEFEDLVVPGIDRWFASEPDWASEVDHLPIDSTPAGAAFKFFETMDGDDLDRISVVLVEGEYPGSDYCAAELTSDIDSANENAYQFGIPVRFRAAPDTPNGT